MANLNKNKKEMVRQREEIIWKLRTQCWTQQRIADHFKIDQTTVAKALKRAGARHHELFMADIQNQKEEQTVQITFILDEAIAAWLKSKGTMKKTIRKVSNRAGARSNEVFIEEYEQQGDPRYIRNALEALDALRKIWGIGVYNLPNGTTVNGQNKDYNLMTMDEKIKFFISIPIDERIKIIASMVDATKCQQAS